MGVIAVGLGLLDLACKLLLRNGPDDLLSLLPGVSPGRRLRVIDKEFTPTPPLPRALDGCLEFENEDEKGTVFHVEFEAEPRGDTGRRVFEHCALTHLGLSNRPIRPVVYFLTPGSEGRRPQTSYGWHAGGRRILELSFEAVCLWEFSAAYVLERPAPALWAAVALCAGVTLADIRTVRTKLASCDLDPQERRDLEAVTYALARRCFSAEDLLVLFSRELLMESDLLKELMPDLKEKWEKEAWRDGQEEGRKEGLRTACRTLMELRAGPLPQGDVLRLEGLPSAALERLLVELGTAQDAEAVRAALARAR